MYLYFVTAAVVIVQMVMAFFIFRSIREKRLFESFFSIFVVMPLVFVMGMRYINDPNELFDQIKRFLALCVRVFDIAGIWGIVFFFMGGFSYALYIYYGRRKGSV